MVGAGAYVRARAHWCATLPNQNVARQDKFAAEALDTQSLGMGIATVSGTAACFFMCHECKSCEILDNARQRAMLCTVRLSLR